MLLRSTHLVALQTTDKCIRLLIYLRSQRNLNIHLCSIEATGSHADLISSRSNTPGVECMISRVTAR